jgi:predicted metal-dependent HD superfamily phosphohydrolase
MTPIALPFSVPTALEAELRQAYADPPRAYHHFGHVEDVLGQFACVTALFHDPAAVALAILFHDAVYVAGAGDNEERSAALAGALVGRHLPHLSPLLPRVGELIRLTARHGKLAPADVDRDAALFLDCDMAILGAAPERFDAYEQAIAVEYAAVPEDAYRAGRAAFLERLLATERIFLSDYFHRGLDAAARTNLRRALSRL